MKSTIISMIIVLILMIAVPLFLFGDGEFTKGFGSGSDSAKIPENIEAVVTDKKVEVYKWVDEHGVMQFSSAPPFEGGESEKIVLLPDTNIMDAIKIPEKEVEEAGKSQVFSLGKPYSPGGMKEMVDESKELKEKLNQRQAEQDKMMQEIFKPKK